MWRAAYGGARLGARYAGKAYRFYKGSRGAKRAVKFAGTAGAVSSGIQAVASVNRKRKRIGAPTAQKRRKLPGGLPIKSYRPGVTTKSFKKIAYKMPKEMRVMKKIGNKCIFRTNTSFGLVGTNGVQCISGNITLNPANVAPPAVYTTTAIQELYAKADVSYNKVIGGAGDFESTPITISTGKTRKMYIGKSEYNIHMSNQAPTTAEVDVYWLMNKNTTFTAEDPITAWKKGLLNTTQGQGGTDTTIEFPGCKPTDSKSFNMAYKVLDKQKVFMVAGADHIFSYRFNPKRILDTSYLDDFNRLKGITLQYIIIAKGSVADSLQSKVVGTISTTDVKLAAVVTEYYETQLLSYYPKVTFYDNKLALNPTTLFEQGDGGVVDAEDSTQYA